MSAIACRNALFDHVKGLMTAFLSTKKTYRKSGATLMKDLRELATNRPDFKPFYESVVRVATHPYKREEVVEIINDSTKLPALLTPQQREEFERDFTFEYERDTVVGQSRYREDLEYFLDSDMIDWECGLFKSGGPKGLRADSQNKTQKKFKEAIEQLSTSDRIAYRDEVRRLTQCWIDAIERERSDVEDRELKRLKSQARIIEIRAEMVEVARREAKAALDKAKLEKELAELLS